METKVLLSILIPVYNGEKYVNRCLDSIIKQNEFNDTIEIILINDGSKDNSLSILKKYNEKYRNIKLISRENKGIGYTRNELLDNASGDFFWFIDIDDFISEKSFSLIIPKLRTNLYDMILIGYYWGDEIKGKNIIYKGEYDSGLSLTDNNIYNNSLWTRIYRTSIINENKIRFGKLSMGEDFDFIFRLIPLLGKVKCIEKAIYKYMANPNSAVGNPDMRHRLQSSQDSLICLLNGKKYIDSYKEQRIKNILAKPYYLFLKGYIHSLLSVPFPWNYKNNHINQLKKMGILNYLSDAPDIKMRILYQMMRYKILKFLLLGLDTLYLRYLNIKEKLA